jgi:hypothetical protein
MRRSAFISIIVLLSCSTAFFGYRYFSTEREFVAASFIHHQIDTTQHDFIDTQPNVSALAFRLAFLAGYFDHHIPSVRHPVLRHCLERDYWQLRTNALITFRRLTNDLGDDVDIWIQTYGK